MGARWISIGVVALAGCSPVATPGMAPSVRRPHAEDLSLDELARVEPARDARPLLVVHPRVACSGSAPTVFLDERGRFYGSLAPGEASLLQIPKATTRLHVVSSVEITAPVRSWFVTSEVELPPFPSGLLVAPRRLSARECLATGQYTDASPASKTKLEEVLATSDVVWLEPLVSDGQRWIDRHRARVDELLASGPGRCPGSLFGAPSYCAEALLP